MIPMSHLSFVQCEQLKFRPKKNDVMKVLHSVVGRGWGGIHVMSHMTRISAMSLICLVLPFLIKPNIFNNLK